MGAQYVQLSSKGGLGVPPVKLGKIKQQFVIK